MPKENQARSEELETPEKEISVDLSEPDPSKAVERRASPPRSESRSDATRSDSDRTLPDEDERADREGPGRSRAEKEMFKRMTRFQRSFEQRQAEREAEWQRERSEMRGEIDRLTLERRDAPAAAAADAAHEAAIRALQDKLAAANEKGDSADAAKITAEMSRLEAQYWGKKTAEALGTGRQETTRTTQTTATQTQTQRQAKSAGPTAAGSRFILANDEWWSDPEFQVEKDVASSIYVRLMNEEGFDANSDETFREVAKQLKKKFPDLSVRVARQRDDSEAFEESGDRTEREEAHRQTRRNAPAAQIADRGAAAGNGARSTRRTLSAQEIKTMRAVGLDPEKNDHVLRFLREAQALG